MGLYHIMYLLCEIELRLRLRLRLRILQRCELLPGLVEQRTYLDPGSFSDVNYLLALLNNELTYTQDPSAT